MLEIKELVWGEWNVNHIAKHGLTPNEVEEAVFGDSKPEIDESYEGRFRIVGRTKAGRMLTVIAAPKGEGRYYPVTARPASRKERRMYQGRRGGEQAA